MTLGARGSVPRIIVVGGGFSGSIFSIRLLKGMKEFPCHITLIEQRVGLGKGLAYGTSDTQHLLNVPAKRMSALHSDPKHFVNWLKKRGDESPEESFASRALYGEYLESSVRESAEQLERIPGTGFEVLHDQVLKIESRNQGFQIELKSGASITGDAVIVATGYNGTRYPFSASESPRYVENPYTSNWLNREELTASDRVLIIGSGLSMVDMALSLSERFPGLSISTLSRHGLNTQSHLSPPPTLDMIAKVKERLTKTLLSQPMKSVRQLFHLVRTEINDLKQEGVPWQLVFDFLRENAQKIWHEMPPKEQERFKRHVQPYWNIHRHRLAPHLHQAFDWISRTGAIRRIAGRIGHVKADKHSIQMNITHRGKKEPRGYEFEWVVNCTGFEARIPFELFGDSLKISKQDARMSRLGQLLTNERTTHPNLFLLGPVLAPLLWEITAVPELRVQVEALVNFLSKKDAQKAA